MHFLNFLNFDINLYIIFNYFIIYLCLYILNLKLILGNEIYFDFSLINFWLINFWLILKKLLQKNYYFIFFN